MPKVRACLERAVELAPSYGGAWACLSGIYADEYKQGYNARPDPLGRALAAARRAIVLDPANATGYQVLAQAHFFRRELGQFRQILELGCGFGKSALPLAKDSCSNPMRPLGSAAVTAMPDSTTLCTILLHSSGVKLCLFAMASSLRGWGVGQPRGHHRDELAAAWLAKLES